MPIRNSVLSAAIAASVIAVSAISATAATFGATSISSPQGEIATLPLANIINQSGLSANYVNGVTDFSSFTSSTTHSNSFAAADGFTNAENFGPQQFSFDLGSMLSVSGIAIWNTQSVGAINSFELLYDDDGDFSNGVLGTLIGPSALTNGSSLADVFSFNAISTRYVHVNGLSSLQAPDFYGLGEVVFDVAPVPVPASLPLLIAGLGGIAALRRRKTK